MMVSPRPLTAETIPDGFTCSAVSILAKTGWMTIYAAGKSRKGRACSRASSPISARSRRSRRLNHGVRLRIATHDDPADHCDGRLDRPCRRLPDRHGLPEPGSTDRWYEVEAWEEALRLTTIGSWQEGTRVNLERSLKIGDELGGHIVSGHVDGKAEIVASRKRATPCATPCALLRAMPKFVAQKGSVALDGTSLTVNKVDGDLFDVLLIRHTLDVTTWGERKVGDFVNFEVDTMARYAARLAEFVIR